MGRKLDFLLQEMNREANTIGSKCTDAAVARVVVEIKGELRKIREQVQNVEEGHAAGEYWIWQYAFGPAHFGGLGAGFGSSSGWCRRPGIGECSSTLPTGRRTRSVILMDTDHVILSALPPDAF